MNRNMIVGFVVLLVLVAGLSVGMSTFIAEKNAEADIAYAKGEITAEMNLATKRAADSAQQTLETVDALEGKYVMAESGVATDLVSSSSMYVEGRLAVGSYGATDTAFDLDPDAFVGVIRVPLTTYELLDVRNDVNVTGKVSAGAFSIGDSGIWIVGSDGNLVSDGDITLAGNINARDMVSSGKLEILKPIEDARVSALAIGDAVKFGWSKAIGPENVTGWKLSVDGEVAAKYFASTDGSQTVFKDGIMVGGPITGVNKDGRFFSISGAGDAAFRSITVTDGVNANLIKAKSGTTTITVDAPATKITGTLAVGSGATIAGGFSAAGGKFTVAPTTGNTAIGGTLSVVGAIDAPSLDVADANITGTATATNLIATNATVTTLYAENSNVTAGSANYYLAKQYFSLDGDGAGNDEFRVSSNGLYFDRTADGVHEFDVDQNGNVTARGTWDVVSGTSTLGGHLEVNNTANVDGDFSVNTNKFEVASATGNTTIGGTLQVAQAATLNSVQITNGATVGGNMLMSSDATAAAKLYVDTLEYGTLSNSTVGAQNLVASSSLNVGSGDFTVDAAGNTDLNGTLDVAGAATVASLTVTNGASVGGNMGVGGNLNVTGTISASNLPVIVSNKGKATGGGATVTVPGMPVDGSASIFVQAIGDGVTSGPYGVTDNLDGTFTVAPADTGDFYWIATW